MVYGDEYFFNREMSWLAFNDRVLKESKNLGHPLFERLKFVAISQSNLDEFFMIRVGSLSDKVYNDINTPDPSGLTPSQQLKLIHSRARQMVEDQYEIVNKSIFPALKKQGLVFKRLKKLTEKDIAYLDEYFNEQIYPVLTPMALDVGRPFPVILSRTLNICAEIKRFSDATPHFATVQVPSVLPRLISLGDGEYCFLEDVIKLFIDRLFSAQTVLNCFCYRITRNADVEIEVDDADDLLTEMEKSIKKRRKGDAIRLEIETGITYSLLSVLKRELELVDNEIYYIRGPLNLTVFYDIYALKGFSHLKFTPFRPHIESGLIGGDIFSAIRRQDFLLHHPYDSFNHVIDFIKQAAVDPDVLAIKQTLYRVSGNSPVVMALERAAEEGKQVTVLIEVKARFDEENNILWAKRLEKAGCHVIYGLVELKTHCKITLVVRREKGSIVRYIHLSTGNYNDITARLYTDVGMFTASPYIGADASALFNMLSGYSKMPAPNKLISAPNGLRDEFIRLISNEIYNAKEGKEAYIIAKFNALSDPEIIRRLYDASRAGVKIELVVRGICCLRPQVANISENIKVRSIVGRFLEHSRVFLFANGGEELIFLSSADLMPRNLDKRVELLFPVEDPELKSRIRDMLMVTLNDKAKMLLENGEYTTINKNGKSSQNYFLEE